MSTTAPQTSLERAFAEEFAHRWLDAWNRHDGQAVAALCTEDVEFFDPMLGTVHGRPAVAEWVATCVRSMPDMRFEEPEPIYLSSDRPKVIAPWHMLATNTGPIDPPGFAATGKAVVVDGVDHWWFRDGLVERYRADYDSLGMLRQLGLMAPAGSRAEKAMAVLQRTGVKLKQRTGR